MKACLTCSKPCTGEYCFAHKPRKPLQIKTTLRPKKRMRRVGKIGKALLDQREQFIRDNPGPYFCIYCTYLGWDMPALDAEAMNVEHTFSKTRHPALRFVKDNLAVSCPFHNELKQSKDIDEFLKILDKTERAI